ncbi:cholinesterase 2-like, partial [Penaeus japonicus]|uniref:cholinesterase 2-like n=1 Tax=Penaeus japonicus TaxID=27405 RepID=UPI001C70DDCF
MRSWLLALTVLATAWLPEGRAREPVNLGHDSADAQDAVLPDDDPSKTQEDEIEVVLHQGHIKTVRQDAGGGGRHVYAFKGIPYAQPPVGELRLRDPVAAAPWEGVRDGTVTPPKCPQREYKGRSFEVIGKEDCLYLSVYTPRAYKSNLPVMVWFHGGGFRSGSGDREPRLAKDLVVVTVHYRLGLLGFLSTEDDVLPGNLGLKDQTMALRWVKDNIHDLGGDPDKVTIFGVSAGGASVHYHILSPMSKGLFTRAIMQSGSALCPWALASNHAKMAIEVMQRLNCSDVTFPPLDTRGLLACLQEVPVKDLLELPSLELKISEFAPRVDGAFLPDHPAVLLQEGRFNAVDLISGTTEQEGASFTKYFFAKEEFARYINDHFTTGVPEMLFLQDGDSPADMARRIFFQYVGDLQALPGDKQRLIEMFGHRFNIVCQDETALLHARAPSGKKVFAYEFSHRPFARAYHDSLSFGTERYAGHLDDLQFLFEGVAPPLSHPQDRFVSRLMMAMWTNFAETG